MSPSKRAIQRQEDEEARRLSLSNASNGLSNGGQHLHISLSSEAEADQAVAAESEMVDSSTPAVHVEEKQENMAQGGGGPAALCEAKLDLERNDIAPRHPPQAAARPDQNS